jgi:hypothetical protein
MTSARNIRNVNHRHQLLIRSSLPVSESFTAVNIDFDLVQGGVLGYGHGEMAVLWTSGERVDAIGFGSNLINGGLEAKVSELEHIYPCPGRSVSGSRQRIFDFLMRAVVRSVG